MIKWLLRNALRALAARHRADGIAYLVKRLGMSLEEATLAYEEGTNWILAKL